MPKNRMPVDLALACVPDDLPDGAFFALAGEFAGMDVDDLAGELAAGPSDQARESRRLKRKRYRARKAARRIAKAQEEAGQ